MPEVGSPNDPSLSEIPEAPTPRKRSIFDDPVVRRMAIAAFAMTVLFLIAALSIVLTGVVRHTGPRSLAEKQVAVTKAAADQNSKDVGARGDYIAALIASGQHARARREIASAKKSIDDSKTAEFVLAEARLQSAQGKYVESIRTGQRAMDMIDKSYQAAIKAGGEIARKAQNDGLPDNYHEAVLVVAYAHVELKQWDKAIESFDVYLAQFSDASDVLVDRGNAKVAAGDEEGAAKDYKTALKYVPDSQEALDGLKKIGAAR